MRPLKYRLKGRKSSDGLESHSGRECSSNSGIGGFEPDQPVRLPLRLAAISSGNCRMSSNVTIGAGGAQRVGMTRPAMAAAVKAEHGHPGGARAGDAGHAVLDHEASRRASLHLFGREQEQVRRRLAARDLRGGENVGREAVVEPGAVSRGGSCAACRSRPRICGRPIAAIASPICEIACERRHRIAAVSSS